MNTEEDGKLADATPQPPPSGLLPRILRRLGLEKQLVSIKHNLELFSAVLLIFLIAAIGTLIVLRGVMIHSSFGPLAGLVLSDPDQVIRLLPNFALSVFESTPGLAIFLFLLTVGLVLLFMKLAATYAEKLLDVLKSIGNQKHG